jgi:hypothetical protein
MIDAMVSHPPSHVFDKSGPNTRRPDQIAAFASFGLLGLAVAEGAELLETDCDCQGVARMTLGGVTSH